MKVQMWKQMTREADYPSVRPIINTVFGLFFLLSLFVNERSLARPSITIINTLLKLTEA